MAEVYQVLIIDDDRSTAEYFQAELSLMGFSVDIVLSAREALSVLATSVPNLVLLDLRLGRELGGEDILYQIRSNPRLDSTRVVVITGYPTTAEMVASLADLVLLKPVEPEQFRTLMSRISSNQVETKVLPFRDPVTGLFNKDFFFTRLDLAFERARRREEFRFGVVVLQVDLPGKWENEVLLTVSIPILTELSERLKRNLRPTDTIARISGWKFVLLYEDLRQVDDVRLVNNRLELILSDPFIVNGFKYSVSCDFGSVVNQPRYRSPEEIYEAAEAELRKAKLNRQAQNEASPSGA